MVVVELGLKNVTIPKAKLTILFFTIKNVIPATVKPYALIAGELLLWVWPTRRAFFLSTHFIEHHDFSPNALKHILSENQAAS